MIPADSPSVLLVSDSADDVKLITVGFRSRFSGCRVEAVYTADQAREWVGHHTWSLIVLDLELPDSSGFALAKELKTRCGETVIVLHSRAVDVSPLQAMRSGATAFLHRAAPSFLSDLLRLASHLVETTRKRPSASVLPVHSMHAAETTGAILYELNSAGRFTYLSDSVRTLLGYEAEELLGTHYTQLLHRESRRLAEQRFNERRAGARATRKLELFLLPKSTIGPIPDRFAARVSARGVYAWPERFLGTVGLIQQGTVQKRTLASKEAFAASTLLSTEHIPAPGERFDSSRQRPLIESIWQTVEHFLGKLDVAQPSDAPMASGSPPHTEPGPAIAPETIHLIASPQSAPVPSSPLPRETPPGPHSAMGGTDRRGEAGWTGADRRSSPRLPVQLPTELLLAGEVWKGLTTSLSESGLSARLTRLPEFQGAWPASVSLLSDVLFLQLNGMSIREDHPEAVIVRVRFGDMEPVKRTVLQSFLNILTDHPDSLKVQIQIPTVTSTGHHAHTPPRRAMPQHHMAEKRLDLRVPCRLAVQLVCRTPHGISTRSNGWILDIHLRGARIRTSEPLPGRVGTCWMDLSTGQSPPRTPTVGLAQETPRPLLPISLVREVTYGADDRARATLSWNYGVRIDETEDDSLTPFRDLVDHELLTYMSAPTARSARTIITDLLWTHNAHDGRIALYHDHMGEDEATPLIILVPDLGQTKEEYLATSYRFAAEGFQVLRYDPTHHFGESDGPERWPLLSHMQSDLEAVLDFAAEFWPATPMVLVGEGLGARLCVRTLQSNRPISAIALVHPPLDLSNEFHRLQHTSLDPLQTAGHGQGIGIFRGVAVRIDRFVLDAVLSQHVSGEHWLHDLRNTSIPIMMVMKEEEFTRHAGVLDHSRTLLGSWCRRIAIDSDAQGFRHTPALQPGHWVHDLVDFCATETRTAHSRHTAPTAVEAEMRQERMIEHQRLQCLHPWTEERRQHQWLACIQHSHLLVRSRSYQKLLEDLHTILTPLTSRQRILEVGCGNGDVALSFLAYRTRHTTRGDAAGLDLPEYVGLDLSSEQLASTHNRILALQNTLSREGHQLLFGGRMLSPLLIRGALDSVLPFPSFQFDLILVTPIFGYMRDPLRALQECVRVLAPGGRLVLILPTPAIDLGRWARESESEERLGSEPGSHEDSLLAVLAELHRGWMEGALHRFAYEDVAKLLNLVGAAAMQIEPILDHQFFRAVARRRA